MVLICLSPPNFNSTSFIIFLLDFPRKKGELLLEYSIQDIQLKNVPHVDGNNKKFWNEN